MRQLEHLITVEVLRRKGRPLGKVSNEQLAAYIEEVEQLYIKPSLGDELFLALLFLCGIISLFKLISKLDKSSAKAASEKGISLVVIDRGGHKYHGIVREVVEAALASGLKVNDKPAEKEAE